MHDWRPETASTGGGACGNPRQRQGTMWPGFKTAVGGSGGEFRNDMATQPDEGSGAGVSGGEGSRLGASLEANFASKVET